MNKRTEVEIATLRRKLRAELQRIDRLLSALLGAQPQSTVPSHFTGSPADDDPPTSDPRDGDPLVLDVEIVVRQVTWHDDDGHPGDVRLQDAFDEYVARNAIDAAWNPSAELWSTPDYDAAASFAEGLSDVQDQWHYLALRKPVESVGYQMNLDSASVEVIAGIAAEFTLPGDTSIKNIKRIVQFTCIAVGVASGQPLLANAGFKSLLHDFVIEAAAKALKHTFTNTAETDVDTDVCQRIEVSFAQLEMKCAQLEGFAFVDERDLAQIKRDFAQIKENLALVKAPERIKQLERRCAALEERIERIEQPEWWTALKSRCAAVESAASGQSCDWAASVQSCRRADHEERQDDLSHLNYSGTSAAEPHGDYDGS